MALMILSTYVKPFIGQAAYYIWLFAIALHIVLIIYFTVKFVFKLQMPKVFASYYIVYVGIVVASVTAPAYEKLAIGSAAFWFGFVTLILLLILVTYRYVTVKEVPDPAKPLICIYAAPTSLCIAGYVQSVMPKSYGFLMGMFVVATVIYISRSFFADSSYMLSFSVLCSCVCSRLISPSVSSWHKQDNTLMHQSPGHIQRRTPYNF